MAEGQVVLSAEEVKVVADLVTGVLRQDEEGGRELGAPLWRLAVKLDRALDDRSGFLGEYDWDLPKWIREILHRTFAPPQVPLKKKPAPAKAGGKPTVILAVEKPKRGLPKGAGLGLKAGAAD